MFIQNFEEYICNEDIKNSNHEEDLNEFVNPKNLTVRKVLGWIIPPFTMISILLYSIRTTSKLLMLSKQIKREKDTEKKERSIFRYMTVKKEYLSTLLAKENNIQSLKSDIKSMKKNRANGIRKNTN